MAFITLCFRRPKKQTLSSNPAHLLVGLPNDIRPGPRKRTLDLLLLQSIAVGSQCSPLQLESPIPTQHPSTTCFARIVHNALHSPGGFSSPQLLDLTRSLALIRTLYTRWTPFHLRHRPTTGDHGTAQHVCRTRAGSTGEAGGAGEGIGGAFMLVAFCVAFAEVIRNASHWSGTLSTAPAQHHLNIDLGFPPARRASIAKRIALAV